MSHQTVCGIARAFLYELPGGVDANVHRDEFLEKAKEAEDIWTEDAVVIEHILRAAFFQGQAVREREASGAIEKQETPSS